MAWLGVGGGSRAQLGGSSGSSLYLCGVRKGRRAAWPGHVGGGSGARLKVGSLVLQQQPIPTQSGKAGGGAGECSVAQLGGSSRPSPCLQGAGGSFVPTVQSRAGYGAVAAHASASCPRPIRYMGEGQPDLPMKLEPRAVGSP